MSAEQIEQVARHAAWLAWLDTAPELDTPPRRAYDAGQHMWEAARDFYVERKVPFNRVA